MSALAVFHLVSLLQGLSLQRLSTTWWCLQTPYYRIYRVSHDGSMGLNVTDRLGGVFTVSAHAGKDDL